MPDRAIEDFTAALRIDPNYANAYNNRGNAYDDKGMYDRAIEDYTAALRIDPNHPNAKTNLELARKARGY
jgi:tetratricopeptide (TPR) repeat protein